MVKYCIKRILLSLLILLGVSLILYVLVRMMPTSYFEEKLNGILSSGAEINKEERLHEMLSYYGLEDSSPWGVITGYFRWLGVVPYDDGTFRGLLQGNLGQTFTNGNNVADEIFKNMGVSFAVSFISLILQLIIAVPLGIRCAVNQYGKLDYFATVLTMIGISFPSFFFGSLLIKIFGVQLGWFPVNGLVDTLPVGTSEWTRFWNMAYHLVLPMIVLVILNVGSMMRYTRTNTLEILNADYIRTARAKGLSENKVIYKHAFRNTLIPLVTTLAGILPGLFGGSMITEQLFALPGIGQMAYQALRSGDIPFIMGYNMFIAVLTVIGILLTDLMYAVVDPRVKLGK